MSSARHLARNAEPSEAAEWPARSSALGQTEREAQREEGRLASLRAHAILDSPPERDFDGIVEIAVGALEVDVAAVCLIDADRIWLKAKKGTTLRATRRHPNGACERVLRTGEPLFEACGEGGSVGSHAEYCESETSARGVVPLRDATGEVLGALGVAHRTPRALTARERSVLAHLGGQAEALLRARLTKHELCHDRPMLDVQRRYFAISPSPMCTLDEALSFVEVNPAWERMTGLPRSRLIGSSALLHIHPEDAANAERWLRAALAEPAAQQAFDCRALDARDGWRYLQWSLAARNGLLYASAYDLTEWRERELALLLRRAELTRQVTDRRASEAQLRAVFDSIVEGVVLVDANGEVEAHNESAARFLDRGDGTLPPSTLSPPPWRTTPPGSSPATPLARALASRQPAREEAWPCSLPDGSTAILQVCALPLHGQREPASDRTLGAVVTFRDRSAELEAQESVRRAEEELSTIIRTSEDAILVVTDGVVETANDAADRLFRTTLRAEGARIVGARFSALVCSATDGTEVPTRGEVRVLRLDGSRGRASMSSSELRVGSIRKTAAILHDEEESASAREVLERRAAIANAANEAKTQFLTKVSHEIRTPMNAVIGMSELLESTALTPTQASRVKSIQTAGEHLLSVLDQVFDTANGKVVANDRATEPFSLHGLCESVCEILAPRAKPGVALRYAPVGLASKERVVGDAARVRQTLFNLVGNALKFTSTGSVTLEVSRDEGLLRFQVRDTGIGIPANRIDAIFESYTQASTSTLRSHGGTGLGLTISRDIVEGLGGRLEVESEEGVGTTFSFELDLPPVDSANPTRRPATSRPSRSVKSRTSEAGPRAAPAHLDFSRLRVLVVDDVELNRDLIQAHLAPYGTSIHHAADGREAVRISGERDFDLILMDIQMPEMDGYEATRLIRGREQRRRSRRCAIVAVTAHAMLEEVNKCLAAGCDAHVPKPITRAKLIDAIRSLFAER